jgi:GNAT superfamily N-acetyltransferase
MRYTVREARPGDAAEAAALLRASITQLCRADHADDARTLEQWLANKTPENFLSWLADKDQFCVVAESDRLVGVGLLHSSGEIRLCYLLPGVQGQGIGKAMLSALEAKARALGLRTLTLESTADARAFYEKQGYRRAGKPLRGFGISHCHPYAKDLG